MCLITFEWSSESARLSLWANRDEFYARPTEPANYWPDAPIWAGRDLQAGGTWLGIAAHGRFAALTNIRDPNAQAGNQSRGALVTDFLLSHLAPPDFATAIRTSEYGGFNLLMFANNQLFITDSRGQTRALPSGIYGLSNDALNTPWPKTRAVMQAWHSGQIEQAMMNTQTYPDAQLPDTGVPIEWERRLSAAFIESADYGTRAVTQIQFTDGEFQAQETSFGPLTGRRVFAGF